MDHDETREQLELAALEPGGLERLMAGDTPMAQAVAGHLAGCPSCTDELARLRRSSEVIRAELREMPPAGLKERSLATIRAEGVQRPLGTAVAPVAVMPLADASGGKGTGTAAPPAAARGRARSALPLIGTIAAAIVLSVVTTTLLVGQRVEGELAAQQQTIKSLEGVSTMSLDVAAEPDAEHVQLVSTTDAAVDGSLVFSPSTTELVVVATGLTEPAPGFEYRCWVEIGGRRERIGRMFFSDDLAYWRGASPAVAGASSATPFGVSLVALSAITLDGDPVLVSSD